MDVNELIDNLRMPSWHDLEDPDATLLADAADALSTLQAENEKLKNAADSWKKKWAGLDKAVRNGSVYRPMQEELNLTHEENQSLKDVNEKLRAELEQVREDNKKLCSAMMTIRRSENSERMCAEYRVDYCTALSHQETADLARIVFEDLMREDARMRGPQKED